MGVIEYKISWYRTKTDARDAWNDFEPGINRIFGVELKLVELELTTEQIKLAELLNIYIPDDKLYSVCFEDRVLCRDGHFHKVTELKAVQGE